MLLAQGERLEQAKESHVRASMQGRSSSADSANTNNFELSLFPAPEPSQAGLAVRLFVVDSRGSD